MELDQETLDRFWSKIDCDANSEKGCWLWSASVTPRGYGQFRIWKDGKWTKILAHRLAYMLHYGSLDADVSLRHTCDNPPCCNPSHLIPGTQTENMRDMVDRGRHHRQIVTQDIRTEIQELFEQGFSFSEIARELELSRSTVANAVYYGLSKEERKELSPQKMKTSLSLDNFLYIDRLHLRFWEKVEKTPNCWLWTGSKMRGDYGTITLRTKSHESLVLQAHRVSYLLAYGDIPAETLVRHKCHTPSCVRPDHLELGTHTDNMQDMVKAGRYTPPFEKQEQKREYIPRPKEYQATGDYQYTRLSPEQRDEIRLRVRSGEDRKQLIKEYNTSARTLSEIMQEDGGPTGYFPSPEQLARDKEAYRLRSLGLSWEKIGKELGVSTMGARKMVLRSGPDPKPS